MPDEVKTEEKVMSPSAFSKFELHVESDGNVLDIPINFGMTDEEVRKIYPYLLSVSRMEDNPMINFARLQESGEINKYTPEQQQKYEIWASRMSKYWYGKPSASLLDVAIGLAIDMKFHGTRLGDIEDIPDNEYEALMQNPANADPAAISDAELSALEQKYGIHPDSDASITLVGELVIGLIQQLPSLVTAGLEMITAFVEGLGSGDGQILDTVIEIISTLVFLTKKILTKVLISKIPLNSILCHFLIDFRHFKSNPLTSILLC